MLLSLTHLVLVLKRSGPLTADAYGQESVIMERVPSGVARVQARIAELRSRFGAAAGDRPHVKDPSRAAGAQQRTSDARASGDFAAYLAAAAPLAADRAESAAARRPAQSTRAKATKGTQAKADASTGSVLLPAVERWRALATKVGREEGVDADLLLALVQQESGGNETIGSHAGAQGLTQLMPATAEAMGVTDPHDPEQNLRGGARYLRLQFERFGTIDLALAAYNAGPNAVRAYGGIPPFPETERYVAAVTALFGRLKVTSGR